jgi:hypothetical protein
MKEMLSNRELSALSNVGLGVVQASLEKTFMPQKSTLPKNWALSWRILPTPFGKFLHN